MNSFHHQKQSLNKLLENYRKLQKTVMAPPPPPPGYYSKAEFLQAGGLIIIVDDPQDVQKFSTMREGEKYLVSFQSGMAITEYFEIKMQLYKIAKEKHIDFRTEISLSE